MEHTILVSGGTSDGMEDTYLTNIVSIRDKSHTTCIKWESLEIKKIITKYSNTNTPIYKLVIDGKPISRNNSLLVKYKCFTCSVEQEITLNLYTRKINNGGKNCISCVNKMPEKAGAQSNFMKNNSSKIIKGEYLKIDKVKPKAVPLIDHLNISREHWNDEDDDFKMNYFMKHLTVDDFERIKHLIQDINNSKIIDLTNWQYEPTYRIWNQTRYTPMLVNKAENVVEKPYYIKFVCENCGEHFTHRDLEIVKNKIKIFCKDCSFTNKTFKLRSMTLKDGTNILWQSLQERRFIEWCESNKIAIKNGPHLPYIFNGVQRTYRVDFELPVLKELVEIKDNHCWYKEQVQSGKQSMKEASANKWCIDNNYKYNILFPKNIQEFKNRIHDISCKI
jgi:DNA-directed RNA polymerase subunit RPC12/RpoP